MEGEWGRPAEAGPTGGSIHSAAGFSPLGHTGPEARATQCMCSPLIRELKNRKKFDPTSMAFPAASAASICEEEVMPVLPSAEGQSACDITRTGRTSHQIGPVLTRELSTTWL